MRIISLLASGTELVCELGAGHQLIGRSHECNHPEWVTLLPSVTRPAFLTDQDSAAIDAEVRRRVRNGEPMYDVDAERISHLQPDVMITQQHCRVCAVSPADFPMCKSGDAGDIAAQTLTLEANDLEAIFAGFRQVADAIGRTQQGYDLIEQYRQRLAALPGPDPAGPRVAIIEWADPLFTCGNWVPQLIEQAGGRPVLCHAGERSGTICWSDLLEADPDWIILAPCGYPLARACAELPLLQTQPGWDELAAIRHGRIAIADGDRYFNRSGPSIIDTAEMLAEIMHGLVPQGRHSTRGVTWIGWTEIEQNRAASL